MPTTTRRTTTYDPDVIAGAERARTSPAFHRALVELAGHDPSTESGLFNDLARIALDVIERRALEIGYQQLAASDAGTRDSVDDFLEEQALAGFDYDDEEPAGLLEFLSQDQA